MGQTVPVETTGVFGRWGAGLDNGKAFAFPTNVHPNGTEVGFTNSVRDTWSNPYRYG